MTDVRDEPSAAGAQGAVSAGANGGASAGGSGSAGGRGTSTGDPRVSAPVVAVVGLGAMGLPMATRLAQSFPVRAFDASGERSALASSAGVAVAATAAEAARGAHVVVLAVRDGAQAEAALFGDAGACAALAPGAIVVLTSTIGPEAARSLAARLAPARVRLVDAPVSGGPVRAGRGDLLVVVGAREADLADARPVLDALASTLTVVGGAPGDGQLLKAINQLLAGVHIAAAAEALALARSVGLDPAAVLEALSAGAGASFMFSDRGPRMIAALEGEPPIASRLDIFVKDMAIVGGIARTAHVPTPVAAAAEQLYLAAERAGLGDHDDSSVIRMLAPRSDPA